jgi:hypothetical protein
MEILDALTTLLVEQPAAVVGPLVYLLMLVITRWWRNPTGAEKTKLKQALTAGALAAAGVIGPALAAEEPAAWGSVIASAVAAWFVAMGLHASGKRVKGTLREGA